ncbi:NADP-dependent oxidoreductase [Nocardiopsis sp. MG754419]|uniref:NADP-dependent oxidoreductase n=1 Tax=Nocardiopsis sp. MG754419 TaxID=2259865 RepID=UPI001BA68BFE|nr:NADP-dependent oxidoreductase [Nocardiopsis sp. MG754419]MBR8741190.1 NADP-dependent oxidoreductase [Nocardiopsis sp. MG754419]
MSAPRGNRGASADPVRDGGPPAEPGGAPWGRAALIEAFGPPDVLEVREVPRPRPDAGEVLVRVRTAGVQPADAAIRGGWTPPGATIVFPQVLGNEFAGVVVETGPGVQEWAIGDEVVGFRVLGCYADHVAVSAAQVVRKPAAVPWPAAGALSASGQTAHTALERLRVIAGETLLVHGAAGGVGTMAVQLAVARGARVVGTASAANQDHVRSLGAAPVVYGPGQEDRIRAAAPQGVDAALDVAGHDGLLISVRLVADRDRVGTSVDRALQQRLGCRWISSDRSTARLAALLDLCARGTLAVTVRNLLPLERVAEAHRDVETGHGRGKVVLRVSEDSEGS